MNRKFSPGSLSKLKDNFKLTSSILEDFDILNKANPDRDLPNKQIISSKDRLRKDIAKKFPNNATTTSNYPETADDYIVLPRVL